MLDPYRQAVLFSEIIAAILSVVFYFKYKNTAFKYILYILWLIVIKETLGYFHKELHLYYTDENDIKYNLWMGNILSFILFPAYYFMYLKTFKTERYQLIIKLFLVIFLIIQLINWVFFQHLFTENAVYPRIIGSIFLTICVIFYFIELLQSDKIISFHRLVPFWISVGLLVFYTSTIPFTVVQNSYMLSNDNAVLKIFIIKLILATAMYLIFAFGFIWSKKE
jgi:hypothetical protein